MIVGLNTDKYSTHFTDEDQISPGLKTYVDVAADHNLISGYPDGTFRPQASITRAEVAALLYRSIKGISGQAPASGSTGLSGAPEEDNSSVNDDATKAPPLRVDVIRQSTTPAASAINNSTPISVIVQGETAPDALVTINDNDSPVMPDEQGKFSVTLGIDKEGTYDYVIVSKRNGLSTTVKKSITITIEAPKLSLEEPEPKVTTSSSANIWFIWTDKNDTKPKLYVNGEERTYKVGGGGGAPGVYNGLVEVALQDGENTFTFKVVNRYGKESNEVTKVIQYKAG
ncbi:S-layer homology domain-containing protein [Cohnella sp. GCM10012308]|uniref:S-layer homology domain-containing protein n=1 Tax=Cohnella sp. GCM10012308 TaxID=3317329 RepID=UPI0036238147